MKKQAIILGFLALSTMPADAAINCAVPPTCESLGYNDRVNLCPKEYLACPIDTTLGKCIHEAAVGQISYFTKDPGKGWLKCIGGTYSAKKYPDLYAVLGDQFGGGGGMFSIPDYRGYFLRVAEGGSTYAYYGGTPNTSVTSPQKEELPNITGYLQNQGLGYGVVSKTSTGVFSASAGSTINYGVSAVHAENGNLRIDFDASKSSSIYKAGGHVIPGNMAVYAYIYAGKVDDIAPSLKDNASSTCEQGYYFYTDGTCEQSYNSSKTVKGIVSGVSKINSDYTAVSYIYGGTGSYSTNNQQEAIDECKKAGAYGSDGGVIFDPYTIIVQELHDVNISTSQNVVRAPKASTYYWSSSLGSKYYCSSATSCNSTTATSTSGSAGTLYKPYYYCYGTVFLY